MFGEQCGQADRFVTEVCSHQTFAAGRLVTLVEEQVKSLQHTVQTAGKLLAGRNLEGNTQLANFLPCSRQSLSNGRFCRKECLRYFGGAETAERLERQSCLCFLRKKRMATGKH